MNAFEEMWLKRRAQFSTVCFLRTSDPKRLDQLIRFIHSQYSSSPKPFRIYVYKPWSALFRVTVSNRVLLEPVHASPPALGPLAGAVPPQPVRELGAALAFLDSEMQKGSERVVAVFWALAPFKSVTDAEFAQLVKFLRNAIFTDDYYVAHHFIIVATEAPEAVADEDTLRHSIVVDVPPSTPEEREALLSEIARKLGVPVEPGELRVLAEALRGLNLHEVESVALEAIFRFKRYDISAMVSFKHELVRKSGFLDVEEPSHGFEAVGGYSVIKEFVLENVVKVFQSPERAQRLGLRPPRGLLFFGPPGTGKTWLARALARELGLPFLRLRGERIVSMWYGETTRLMGSALRLAEAVAPAVLFIDEIDRFGRRGGLAEHEESRRTFSVLLEWLGDERRRTIVVGTTNRPQDLDEAFVRVGRFDYIIPVLYPDRAARLEILRIHTSTVRKVPVRGVDLDYIADKTELWTGAELEELVLRAARNAFIRGADTVEQGDFDEALYTFRIDMEQRFKQLQDYLRLADSLVNDARFLERVRKLVGGVYVAGPG